MSRLLRASKSPADWMRDHRAQLALSIRMVAAVLLSFVVSNLLHLPLPLWTVLTAVILTQLSFGSSLKATIDYMLGTLCGALYAGAIAVLIPHDNQVALAAVLAIVVAPLALIGALRPNFAAATFTGVLVLLVPQIAHVGPLASAIDRVLEVMVGGLTALAVSAAVLPMRAHNLLVDTAARTLDSMARVLPELAAALTDGADAAAMLRLQDGIGEAMARLELLAREASHERIGFLAAGQPDAGPLVRTLLRLRHDLVMIGRAAATPLPAGLQEQLGPALRDVAAAAADDLRKCADALNARREAPPLAPAERALDRFTEAFAAVRQAGLTRDLPVDAVERVFALGFAFDQMHRHVHDLRRCVSDAARRS